MAATAPIPAARPVATPVPVSWRELSPFLVFGGLIALLALYFVGAEEGATSMVGGVNIHEWVHDARHLLGFPCH